MFSKVPPCYDAPPHADEEPHHRGTTAKGAPPALPTALGPTALERHGPDVMSKRPLSPVGDQPWEKRRKRKKVAGVYK